ncbi:MAG: 5'-3' exonuclease H3TH domain-containing protein [Candidatus Staskawiczbacteria bacterium]|nr:5'-3' exonuclease H3TH domain-containing protein [Candidatus Staskawiczbacteria bacterium]
MKDKKRLIIIDSNSLLHRAFHALPPLKDKSGEPTGAIYGFLLILFKAINDLKADYIVACFDTKAPTFRHQKFKDYKAHRPKTPNEILLQFPKIKEILEKLKIPIFAKEGFEADDLIATITKMAKNQSDNLEIYILSGDLDNLQLIDKTVKVYTLGKGIKDSVIYDEDRVVSRFGVKPSQMVDFKALSGDSADNISGVPGIGKKTAAELIIKFNSVKNLYSEISQGMANIKTRIKDLLLDNKQTALLSLELVEMKNDVNLDFLLENCEFGKFNLKEVEEKLIAFDFNTLISRLPMLLNR